MKTTGKVQRFPQKNGVAYAFKIVHNYWDKVKGHGTNKLIKTILYVGVNQNLNDPLFRVYAWNKINKELTNLCLQNIVSRADADTARMNFAKVLPPLLSSLPFVKPIAASKPDPLAKYRNFINGKN